MRAKLKPGESITVKAYALELYNEELRDLSSNVAGVQAAAGTTEGEGSKAESGVRIAERPYGREGKCIPEVRFGQQLQQLHSRVMTCHQLQMPLQAWQLAGSWAR